MNSYKTDNWGFMEWDAMIKLAYENLTIQLLVKEIIKQLNIGDIETYAVSPSTRTVITKLGTFHLEIFGDRLIIHCYTQLQPVQSSTTSFALSNPNVIACIQEYFDTHTSNF